MWLGLKALLQGFPSMRRFPQFLKTNPVFNGLTFTDMGALVAILYLSMIFRLPTLMTIGLAGTSVLLSKLLTKNFDLVGFLLPRKRVINLRDIYRGEK